MSVRGSYKPDVKYNAKRKKNRRTMNTHGAKKRLFAGRKHRPCHYCGKKLSMESATFDHVVPLSHGGYDKTSNGVLACNSCNQAKWRLSREQYINKRAQSKGPTTA